MMTPLFLRTAIFAFALSQLLLRSVSGGPFVIPENMPEIERKRFERFTTFQIKGVCGDTDLDRLAAFGVNTVRGYTIDDRETMRKKLDHAHRLGMKMILSEWMPHHGDNKNKAGHVWTFDYDVKGDAMVSNLMRRIEAIGDHPAILMWGLGNEVHLDEPYLRVVNRMSQEIHKRFPHHITSLTMINAKPENIQKVKEHAPDLDVLGIQSYSRGAVRGGIRNAETHWAKPFYLSEFNTNGPWNFKNTDWDVPLDEPVSQKVSDLKDCYAAIDASPLCLGSTIFVWGHHPVGDRPTYFSLLLDPHPEGASDRDQMLIAAQADVMAEHFTGRLPYENRAPVLTKLEFDGGDRQKVVAPGELMTVRFAADDANGDDVQFVSWILKSDVKTTTVKDGPFPQTASDHVAIKAPDSPGEYLVMVYAKDKKGGASATVLPFLVSAPESRVAVTASSTAP